MAQQIEVPKKKRKRVNPSFRWGEGVTLNFITKTVECVKDSPESFEKPTAHKFYDSLAKGSSQLEAIPWTCMKNKMRYCKNLYIAASKLKRRMGAGDEKSVIDNVQRMCPHYEELHQIFGQMKNINLEDDIESSQVFEEFLYSDSDSDNENDSFKNDRCLSVSCEDANPIPEKLPETSAEEICSVKNEETVTKPNYINKYIQYICEICGQDFKYKRDFNAHINRHLGLFPYECKLCPQKFNAEGSLRRHMRKHSGTLPFTCRFCKRKFMDSSVRTRCERMCSNDRPFKCSFCDKGFTAHYILKNHLITHTGERPFSCTICQRTFSLKKHLATHFKSTIHKQNETKSKLNDAVDTSN